MTYRYEFVINPGIARVASSKAYVPYFSFGENLKENRNSDSYKFNASFKVLKDINFRRTADAQKFHFFWGHENGEEIYYERPTGLPGVTAKMRVRNLLEDVAIEVNSQYYKYIRIKVGSLYPPGVHLSDIVSANLLRREYSPLHCAALSRNNEAVLLIAPPDTGKTLTTLLALKEGFRYLAEDIAFIDSVYVYSNRNTSTFLHSEKKLGSFFYNNPLAAYYIKPRISASNIFGNCDNDDRAVVKNIFLLDRGTYSSEKIDSSKAMKRILIINRNEFSYFKNSLLFAYSYLNPSLDLSRLLKMEESIIQTMVNKSSCYLLKTNEPKDYIKLVLQSMN